MTQNKLKECACGQVFITKSQLDRHKERCEESEVPTQEMVDFGFEIESDRCAEWRRRIGKGEGAKDIAQSDGDVCRSTVSEHVNGTCDHSHDESSWSWNNKERKWERDE